MTSVKVSALPAAGTLNGSETVPVVQGGATKGATASQITASAAKIANNLSDIDNKMAAVVNLGTAAAVENVTALSALTAAPKVIDLQGYETLGDGGGGLLVHDSGSAATVDSALVFPAITGRYTRPVDGVLHSKWFGLKHSTSLDQSVKMQNFLYTICEPQQFQYRGFLDPGTHDCAGATLYWKRNTGGVHQMASTLEGASRRLCIIRNATLAVGSAPWFTLVASVANMRNIRVEGFLDILNCEGNSLFENVSVARPPDITFDRAGYPTDAVNPTPPFPLAFDATDWAGWMMNVYACNHPLFLNLTVDGHVGHLDYKKGLNSRSTANARFIQGTTFGCNPGTELSGALTIRNHLDGHKYEQCEGTQVWNRGGHSNIISIYARQGAAHDGVSPLVRIGEAGVATPDGTTIRNCVFLNDQAGVGTAIKLEALDGVTVEDNNFADFATGIDWVSTGSTNDVDIGRRNIFTGTTTPINKPTAATGSTAARRQRGPAVMVAPLVITDAATINWDVRAAFDVQVTVAGNRTIAAPTNIRVGERYRFILIKSNGAAVITWNAIFVFAGAAPNFAAMTTSQHAVVTMDCIDAGAGAILSCSYEIVGTVTAGAVTQATSKATGVTLNFTTGAITMNAAELAADTTVSFTLTNGRIAANDVLALNHVSGGTVGAYTLNAQCAAGSATINVRNITALTALSEAVVISFIVIKAVT